MRNSLQSGSKRMGSKWLNRIKSGEVVWFLILATSFMIPISQFLSIRLIVISLIFSFFVKVKPGSFTSFFRQAVDITMYLTILVMGLVYTGDLDVGVKVLETSFSLLALPWLFSKTVPLSKEKLNFLFFCFSAGLMIASLICLSFAFYRFNQSGGMSAFFFDEFTSVINAQPTYFAYYLIFTISVGLYFLYYDRQTSYQLLKYLIVLFFFLVLILTGGQTAFISLLFVFSFFILKFFTEEVNSEKRVVTCLIVLMLSCMFLISIVEKGNLVLTLNDSWERAILWESAISANATPFFGVGTGDYKIALNDYYITHNLTQFATESYNSHNQFIQILFSNGVLGILAFSFMLGRPLYMAMKSRNILVILCMFPFLIYGMTEVFLGRYQGVVFFALLHQIFIADINSDISRAKIPLREP